MRRAAAFCVFLSILCLFTACSLPFGLKMQPEEDSSALEHTFVITTDQHVGSARLTDKVQWYANTLAALEYVGKRGSLESSLKSLYQAHFSDLEQSDLLDLKQIDLGGDDVFLVVPRFDQETMSVFTISVDSEGNAHILSQAADLQTPFLLLCNATDKPNAQLGVTLVDVPGRFRTVVRRDPGTGDLLCTDSFQPMKYS